MSNPTIGSVNPFMMPMMGVSAAAGLNLRNDAAFSPKLFADENRVNQSTIFSE